MQFGYCNFDDDDLHYFIEKLLHECVLVQDYICRVKNLKFSYGVKTILKLFTCRVGFLCTTEYQYPGRRNTYGIIN